MVFELKDYNMTDNNSHSTHTSPELHRNKLRSSFKMIRKLFKTKKQASASTGDLSTHEFEDDDHASPTGSPPPPYRSDSFDKSVMSIGSASSSGGGGDINERRELLKSDNSDATSSITRVVTVTIRRDSDTLLGIVIGVSNEKGTAYPVVRRVLPDSQASKSGAVFCGDEILKVNNTDVYGMTHRQVTSLFKSNGRQLILQVRRKVSDFFSMSGQMGSAEASPHSNRKHLGGDKKSQVIEICRDDSTTESAGSAVPMSTFHPTSPTARMAPQMTSFKKTPKIPLPGLQQGSGNKNENEDFERFNRRSYSASAAVRSMKSPRHTLLVPGSADINLITIHDILAPQSAPASPAESRRFNKEDTDEEPDKDEEHNEYRDSNDVTEAWSAAPFVRSHSMRQPKRTAGNGWRDRSASQSERKKGSHRRLRDSFRIGRKTKQADGGGKEVSCDAGKSEDQKSDSTSPNKNITVSLSVPSLQELGLRLAGGSVSPYGTCKLTAQSVSVYGTAKEVVKPGDSILTVDGINTEQMTAFEAYRLLQNYIGRTVKVELARGCKK